MPPVPFAQSWIVRSILTGDRPVPNTQPRAGQADVRPIIPLPNAQTPSTGLSCGDRFCAQRRQVVVTYKFRHAERNFSHRHNLNVGR